MPNHRKPAGTQQDQRPQRAVELHVVEGEGTPDTIPPIPLDEPFPATVDAWNLFWESHAAGLSVEIDAVQLRRYFWTYNEWLKMALIVEETPFTKGSTGQDAEHPASKMLARHDATLREYEKQFGIGVHNRHLLGITIGQGAMTAHQVNQMTQRDSKLSGNGEYDVIEDAEIIAEFDTGG